MKKILFNSPSIIDLENIKKLKRYKHFGNSEKFTKNCVKWITRNINCKMCSLLLSFTTTVLLIIFFSSINFLGLGIVASYLLNICIEVKRRSLFFVKKFFNLKANNGFGKLI